MSVSVRTKKNAKESERDRSDRVKRRKKECFVCVCNPLPHDPKKEGENDYLTA